ncbi:MAG: DUF1553 domain-containing protein, partial [Planctomycetaceae bacterium]|nr:DUF1553 domain-containing protein [Planctomycetaceae bacterium]
DLKTLPQKSRGEIRHAVQQIVLVWIVLFASGSHGIADEREEFFETHIRPLLAEKFLQCHGAEKQESGLRLDTAAGLAAGGDSGPVISTADPSDSRLIQAVRYNTDLKMPPDKPLSESEQESLRHWVSSGASWPKTVAQIASRIAENQKSHWAFQPVTRPEIPNVDKAAFADPQTAQRWSRNPIDAFVLQRLTESGLQPSPEADRRTLFRRVSYALTGLPPSAEQVETFVADDNPDAYDRLVDQLLASPEYGQHWARHWLDIARYSDSKGYVYAREHRFWVHAWTYRDWVVRALNDDVAYDRFLLLQIAADQTDDREDGDLAAMGFLTLGRRFLGVQRDIIDDRIDVVTRGTMGLTVGCARCHDHKYDPVPTADYYSLYGVFDSCRERLVPLRSPSTGAAGEEYSKELQTRLEKLESTLQSRRKETADRLRNRIADYLRAQFELEKYPEEGFDQVIAKSDLLPSFVRRWQETLRIADRNADPVFAAWHAFRRLEGAQNGTAENSAAENAGAEFSLPSNVNRRVAAAFASPPASWDDVIRRYADLFAAVDREWQAACSAAEKIAADPPQRLEDSDAEQLRQVLYGERSPCVVPNEPIVHTEYDFDSGTCNELWKLQGEVDRWIIDAPEPQPFALVLEDRSQPVTARIFRRGNPAQKGDEVPRRFLTLLAPQQTPFQHGSGRLELARAIISSDNPLTGRVIINRLWAQHFGTGLVSTPGDFGLRSSPPSHPELLDWLTTEFLSTGQQLKALHRLIVTSAAFRQTSGDGIPNEQLHAGLQTDPGNRLLWRMNARRLSFEEMRDSFLAVSGELDLTAGGRPAELFAEPYPVRRTLYGTIDRQFLPSTLRVFDFANPDLHIPERSETTVPQQALFLMNHPLVLERVRRLAEISRKQTTDDSESRDSPAMLSATVVEMYRRVLQRTPSETELASAVRFLHDMPPSEQSQPRLTAKDWSYGFGTFDETQQQIVGFTPLPHFTGTAWQGGPKWPDAKLGWVQLTATGGHPGNDRSHASVRRWTAPRDMTVSITSEAIHEAAPGDGIRVFIVSSVNGLLQSAVLHQDKRTLSPEAVPVRTGDTIDFVCDIGDVLNSDQHLWRIQINETPKADESDAPA